MDNTTILLSSVVNIFLELEIIYTDNTVGAVLPVMEDDLAGFRIILSAPTTCIRSAIEITLLDHAIVVSVYEYPHSLP